MLQFVGYSLPKKYIDRGFGDGHYHQVYDPSEHGITFRYIDPPGWEKRRVAEAENDREKPKAVISAAFLVLSATALIYQKLAMNFWPALYLGGLMTMPLIYSLAIMDEEGLGWREEMKYGWQRFWLAVVFWPISCWFYPCSIKPIGFIQQAIIEAAYRRKYRRFDRLTLDERKYIEALWLRGYEQALEQLSGRKNDQLRLVQTTEVVVLSMYVLVSFFWLTVGTQTTQPDQTTASCQQAFHQTQPDQPRNGPTPNCSNQAVCLEPSYQRSPTELCIVGLIEIVGVWLRPAPVFEIDHVPW